MVVSGTPKIIHFNRVFHYKPSILGVPLFLETTPMRSDILGFPRSIRITGRRVRDKNLFRITCLTIEATKIRGVVLKSTMALAKKTVESLILRTDIHHRSIYIETFGLLPVFVTSSPTWGKWRCVLVWHQKNLWCLR